MKTRRQVKVSLLPGDKDALIARAGLNDEPAGALARRLIRRHLSSTRGSHSGASRAHDRIAVACGAAIHIWWAREDAALLERRASALGISRSCYCRKILTAILGAMRHNESLQEVTLS